jgi:hypothetical protein
MVTAAPAPFVLPPAACLPVERVFVLQLALGADGAPLQGRVEHVLTGRQADFASLADLQAALVRCQRAPQP